MASNDLKVSNSARSGKRKEMAVFNMCSATFA